ncbi:unnamed protein product [Sphagnum troendelagicum]|uniref:Extradiol ring-cleavage dioxygenase class III enzyme subunit B domain-containing protein n=1 Tax=Sphagnum troendelagicum TaxID=128251 RepID=A0ABP0UVF6_9BRYO
MSTYYVSHGSPMLALEDTPARDFLKQFAALHVPERPKAILAISAHWDTNVPAVTAVSKNSTIHDFYGFPSELYQLQYPAPGMPELARRVKELLVNAGFQTVVEDKKRGLDHGAWVPLLLAYPDADIPVVQLSIQSCKDGAYHYKLGQALAPLKDEGFLVLGSGSATHNLRQFDFSATGIVPWAKEFDDWLYESLNNNRHEEVINWLIKAPHARRAHPSPDHFMPLLVALGAASEKPTTERIHSSFQMGTFSMASFAFHGTGSK